MNNIYEAYLNSINEVLSTPYNYKWVYINDTMGICVFKTSDGRKFIVYIKSNADEYEITFADISEDISNLTMGLTNEGDQFKILSTVLKIVSEYVIKYLDKINVLQFIGEKSPNQSRKGDSGREKLYTRLFNKYMPPGKWTRSIQKEGWRTIFTYTKV